MTLSNTDICNMALARIGAQRINDLDTDANVQAIHCRLFFEPDRDALLRSHWWPFAGARATLATSVATPTFEFSYKYALPNDYLALRSLYEDNGTTELNATFRAAIEGDYILCDQSSVSLRYTKQVTDPAEFDPLFVRTLMVQLALDLLYPLTKTSASGAADRLKAELDELMVKVSSMDRQEMRLVGREAMTTWLDARKIQSA